MTSELKPCPFCGGRAAMYEEIIGGYIVQCHDCCGQVGIMTREHAIAAWNQRHVETCEYKPMWNDDGLITGEYVGMWWTGCGEAIIWNGDNDKCGEPPFACPYCGGIVKVVG